jgi:hypothetical protein
MAGTGKSTISATVAQFLDNKHYLGGVFFFSRSDSRRSSPQAVFSAIVSQLAIAAPGLAGGILGALEENPGLPDVTPATQFRKLLATPLRAADGLSLPIVMVFDALDECDAPGAILSALRAELSDLPPLFKILIASRPELIIKDEMDALGASVTRRSLELDDDVTKGISNLYRNAPHG